MAAQSISDKCKTKAPSAWVLRFLPPAAPGQEALDVAAGGGRHSLALLELGYRVLAVDRDTTKLEALAADPRLAVEQRDLEGADQSWPPAGRRFAAIVVTNYLFRPLLERLPDHLVPGGLLIYETFSLDNLKYGRPSNPEFLLRPGELLEACRGRLRVLAYEDCDVVEPWPAAVQRIAARKEQAA